MEEFMSIQVDNNKQLISPSINYTGKEPSLAEKCAISVARAFAKLCRIVSNVVGFFPRKIEQLKLQKEMQKENNQKLEIDFTNKIILEANKSVNLANKLIIDQEIEELIENYCSSDELFTEKDLEDIYADYAEMEESIELEADLYDQPQMVNIDLASNHSINDLDLDMLSPEDLLGKDGDYQIPAQTPKIEETQN